MMNSIHRMTCCVLTIVGTQITWAQQSQPTIQAPTTASPATVPAAGNVELSHIPEMWKTNAKDAVGLITLTGSLTGAYDRRDATTLAKYSHEHIHVVLPDSTVLSGREAVKEFYDGLLQRGITKRAHIAVTVGE
jgi:hypothetical protein